MNAGYYFELRRAYVTVISALTYNGNPLDVFDSYATDEQATPYVIIDNMQSNDQRNKNDTTEDCAVTVHIVSGAVGGGRKQVDEIASLIFAAKSSLRSQILTAAISLMDTYKITDNTLTVESATERIYRRIITFGHIVTV